MTLSFDNCPQLRPNAFGDIKGLQENFKKVFSHPAVRDVVRVILSRPDWLVKSLGVTDLSIRSIVLMQCGDISQSSNNQRVCTLSECKSMANGIHFKLSDAVQLAQDFKPMWPKPSSSAGDPLVCHSEGNLIG